jgi:hypothetical protein
LKTQNRRNYSKSKTQNRRNYSKSKHKTGGIILSRKHKIILSENTNRRNLKKEELIKTKNYLFKLDSENPPTKNALPFSFGQLDKMVE